MIHNHRRRAQNFVGKLIISKFNYHVEIAGQNVICEIQEKDIPNITAFLISKKIPIFGITSITKSLEEIFLEIVNKK